MPWFSLPSKRYKDDGVLTAQGQQTARGLLREIYEACCFYEANEGSLLAECWRIRKKGKWRLVWQWLRAADWLENWFSAPLLVLIGFLTDWALVDQCRNALEERFSRKLPEDIGRNLLCLVEWGQKNAKELETCF